MVELDWKLLDSILMFKASLEDCADICGCSSRTITRNIEKEKGMTFSEYRTRKMAKVRTNLASKQYQVAMSGNVSMLIWLGKQWLGQKDKHEISEEASLTFES